MSKFYTCDKCKDDYFYTIKHECEFKKSRWGKWLDKFWSKKKSVQKKIDNLANKIHLIEVQNSELIQGTALSKRQVKRIQHDKWLSDNGQ